MRLGDLDAAKESLFSYYSCVNENTHKSNYMGDTLMSYEVADMIEDCLDGIPTIDPETLPIVLQLREELERVTAERDAAVDDLRISAYCKVCKTRCSFTEALSRRSNGSCKYFEWRGLHKEE